jgi:hypothetical protein
MANVVSSVPLFGSPTNEEVEEIKGHMRAFAADVAKNPEKARKLLEEIGAIAPEPEKPRDSAK